MFFDPDRGLTDRIRKEVSPEPFSFQHRPYGSCFPGPAADHDWLAFSVRGGLENRQSGYFFCRTISDPGERAICAYFFCDGA
jgi:hypothetical protein